MMEPIRIALAVLTSACVAACLLVAGVAYADKLELSPDAHGWAQLGATALLFSHIGGGTVGLLAGTTASLARKGGRLHRASGRIFWVAMFVTYLIGAGVAPFLNTGQRPNFVAGILALYLLVTGVMAATRRDFRAGPVEKFGLVVALSVVGLGVSFMVMGASSETGTVDGSPPPAFLIFVIGGAAAAVGEVNVLVRGSLGRSARIVRHLWRMCFSFFIASGSLFLGQPGVFPQWFNDSMLPVLLAFAPIFVLVFWVIKVRGTSPALRPASWQRRRPIPTS